MSQVMVDRGILEIEALPFWTGPIKVWPLVGGTTNRNYGVQQADGQRFAVRLGQDLPHHGVMRFNEQAAAKAAAKVSISPKIYYTAPGVMVSRLLPGRALIPDEVRDAANLARIVALIKRCHEGMQRHLTGPLLAFWVFHINRSYLHSLAKCTGPLTDELQRLTALNDELEQRTGKVDIVYGHNDLLAANIFDDGARLWLLDWDYAGFNTPLFDLANLSSNNAFRHGDDASLLELYFGGAPAAEVVDTFKTLKCASLLRETLWGAISAESSSIVCDFTAYSQDYLTRLNVAVAELG